MPCNSVNLPAADRCGRPDFSNRIVEPTGVLIVPLDLEEWCLSFCGALSDSHAVGIRLLSPERRPVTALPMVFNLGLFAACIFLVCPRNIFADRWFP